MKTFEYVLLERILPMLENSGHLFFTQTAYRKCSSCQNAIFATQEAILKVIRDDGEAYLWLHDLEKAFDSIEHSILLNSLYDAGVNGKAWRVVSSIYNNLNAVVKSGSSYSSHFPISRGVQQGSVLSPTFFLVVIDKLLSELSEKKAGVSICELYLGGAAHADDVRTVATSAKGAEEQGLLISDFADNNGLTLNRFKTEVVKISRNHSSADNSLMLLNTSLPIVAQAKCLGYQWNKSLSAKTAVEENIAKARRQFFALGSTGCYLGHSNLLTARVIVETCVTPTLLYAAENWILDDVSHNLLEGFQAEIGRRILRLSRFHSHYSVLLALLWPTMKARVLSFSLDTCLILYLLRLITLPQELSALLPLKMCTALELYNNASPLTLK